MAGLSSLLQLVRTNLVLHARNRMALVYGYIFPTLFLIAFAALYRYERVPLVAHMGELLAITALGGACFGLPTTMVAERERGVWRRYRLTPTSPVVLVAAALIARYVLLMVAVGLQIALAIALGLPVPDRPLELWAAVSVVAFALMGLGLVIAVLADSVPTVQALGQCVFLPMLIIGGIAVPLSRLPDWASAVSAFLPGRYAVSGVQSVFTGAGLGGAWLEMLALVAMGAGAFGAALALFRWDPRQHFADVAGKRWLVLAVVPWIAVGVFAQTRDPQTPRPAAVVPPTRTARPSPQPLPFTPSARERAEAGASVASVPPTRSNVPSSPPTSVAPRPANPEVAVLPSPPAPAAPTAPGASSAADWRSADLSTIDAEIAFERLPPDQAVVTPVAGSRERPDAGTNEQLWELAQSLETWAPGRAVEPLERVRNLLLVAGMLDLVQHPLEPFAPALVFAQIEATLADPDLSKVLLWIAIHPEAPDPAVVQSVAALGFDERPAEEWELPYRVSIYAAKLLGRVTGRIPR